MKRAAWVWAAAGGLGLFLLRKAPSAATAPAAVQPPPMPTPPAPPAASTLPAPPQGSGQPPARLASWRRVELGPELALDPGTYAGVFELEGFEATFGDADNIADKLRELAHWSAIEVSESPAVVPPAVPITRTPAADRYWAFGTLAAGARTPTPEQLRELWRLTT